MSGHHEPSMVGDLCERSFVEERITGRRSQASGDLEEYCLILAHTELKPHVAYPYIRPLAGVVWSIPNPGVGYVTSDDQCREEAQNGSLPEDVQRP